MQSRNRDTEVENKPKGKGCGVNWEIGIDIYTLLYIKKITNKNLRHNTGTLLNALWGSKWEGNLKKEGGYMYTYN